MRTSSNAHKISVIRKRNHKALVASLLSPLEQSQMPPIVEKNLKHGVMYESVAREKYFDILNLSSISEKDTFKGNCISYSAKFVLASSKSRWCNL